jgi:two-component system response regulator DevR
MTDDRIPIVLIEDDAIVRAWARQALEGSELRIAGEASSVAKALEMVTVRHFELALVDYRLADGLGTDLVRELRRRGISAPALVMTAHEQEGLNEVAREAGAQGTALKSAQATDLLHALRTIRLGGVSFDPRHPRRPVGRDALSRREREVLRHVADGSTNKEIATILGVSSETIKTTLDRVFNKLGAHRRAEAVSEAQRLGLI